jgi:uncharacterized membrane protein HdeD (DUF308 family)
MAKAIESSVVGCLGCFVGFGFFFFFFKSLSCHPFSCLSLVSLCILLVYFRGAFRIFIKCSYQKNRNLATNFKKI